MRKTLNLLLLASVFLLTSCSHHIEYRPGFDEIEGQINAHGIAKQGSKLYSFSSISGATDSHPDDYISFGKEGDITFFALPEDISNATSFIETLCCDDGAAVRSKILEASHWIRSQFDNSASLDIELVLVPANYAYQYSTWYKVEGNKGKVRFAFHYEKRAPNETIVKIVDTLAHELTHALFHFQATQPKNLISSETLATLAGICAGTFVEKKIPIPAVSVLPDESTMDMLRNLDDRTRAARLQENRPFLISNIFVQLIVEEIIEKHSGSDLLAAKSLMTYCETALRQNPDFNQSLELK